MRLKYANARYLAKVFRLATIQSSFVKQYSVWCGDNNFVAVLCRPFRYHKVTKLYASSLSRTQLGDNPGQTFV